MPRLVILFYQVLLFYLIQISASRAQAPVRLLPQPDTLRHIRVLEREAIQKNDSLLLAEVWYRFGKTYELNGDLQTSQRYFLKSLRIIEPRGDSPDLSRLYARLSNYEVIQHNYPKAVAYAKRSLQVARRLHSDKALIRAYQFLGKARMSNWDEQLPPDKASFNQVLTYYKNAEMLCLKLQDTLGVAELDQTIGDLFLRVGDPQAIHYMEKALQLFTLKNKQKLLPNVLMQLSSAYLLAGREKAAWKMLLEAEQMYKRNKLDDHQVSAGLHSKYATYFEATQQWQKALTHHKRAQQLERQQLVSDRNGAISRLNIEYETYKKEALLQAKNRELAFHLQSIQTQQRLIVLLVLLFLFAAWLSVVFFRLYRKNQRISRQNEELVKEQNHRVKNNLQVVSNLLSLQANRLTDETTRQAIEESQLRIQAMAILHRRLYDDEQLATTNLSEFIPELVTGVLYTFGYTTLPVQYSIDGIWLSADQATPLGLILNELVTNACKYAFPHAAEPMLSIRCRLQKRTITLVVADNGPGLAELDLLMPKTDDLLTIKSESFGFALIQAQISQLNGTGRFTDHDGVVFTLTFDV